MKDEPNTARFLNVDEAAQLVGLSHWTIRAWLHRGLLTRYKAGSRTVVCRNELLSLVRPKAVREAASSDNDSTSEGETEMT